MKSYLTEVGKNLSATLFASLLIVGATPCIAEMKEMEEVAVIATRSETLLSQLPSNITVIDVETLKRISATHIQQALNRVPGVNYHRGNGQESLPAIRSAVLTGAGACGNVLVLEEGIAVRGAGFCNVNELFDTHFEQAGQIEIVRGANTAFYGSNALLGSINVGLPSTGDNYVAVELGANHYWRTKLAVSYGDATVPHGRFYLSLAEDGGFRDESGYQQQKLSWRHETAFDGWDLKLGATATYLDQQTAGFIVGLDSYRDARLVKQNLDPEAFRETSSMRAWATFSKSIGDKKTIKITPYLRFADTDFLQHFLPGNPLEQNRQQGIGWQSGLSKLVSDQFSWSLGFDGEFSQGELLQTQALPTRGSAFLQATIPIGVHYDLKVDARQLAVFGHFNYQPREDLKLIGGLRLERISYHYDNLAMAGRTRGDGSACGFGGCRYSRPADRQDNFSHALPKLELQYNATDNWRLHIAVANSFRAPQATELYRLQREQVVADLDEVRARHFELGSKWQTESMRLALSFYQIDQRNVIIRDSDFFNIDGQRIDSKGAELEFTKEFSTQWAVRLVAAYAKHKYASDPSMGETDILGNEVDTAPQAVGSLIMEWNPTVAFSSELEVQHVSDYYLEPQNEHQYPGHTLLNLRTTYQLDARRTLSLRLLNVLDRAYAERADFTTFSNERYLPGEPRSLYGEIRWRF